MPCGDLRCRTPVEQPNRVLGATVDGVDEKQLGDAVVVVGLRLEIEFLDRTRALIAPGLGKRHGRWLIRQDVDHVLGRSRNQFSARTRQSDFVIPLALDGQARCPRAVSFVGEFHRLAVDQELPARCEHRREDSQPHHGPSERGDVAPEFDRAGSEPRVRRKAIFQLEVLHIREIGHLDSVCGRSNAAGLDEIIRVLIQAEKKEFETPGSVRNHEKPVEPVRGFPTEEDLHVLGLEALELGRDQLIGPTGDRDVAGAHGNRIRVHRPGIPGRKEEGRCPTAELGRSQEQ